MKAISLFNGISCGRVAFECAGIPIEQYASFEIDKYANQVARSNYPHDEYNGDVFQADFTRYKGFDILIGGSPCTHWSIAKQGREITSSGIGWELFMQFVRALRESGCRYFLYENNFSIHKDIQQAIGQELGVQPIMINSALVSAQQRKRLYWTNIQGVEQPTDKGILLKDVLESGLTEKEKSYCIAANEYKGVPAKHYLEKRKRQQVFEPVIFQRPRGYNNGGIKYDKCPTLTTSAFEQNNYVCEPVGQTVDGKAYALKANYYKSSLANFQGGGHYPQSGVAEPVRIGNIGETIHNKQGYRVYSVQGKSICLSSNGSGVGGKTGLYYINLPDGDYIIRKLTPVECERLQTLPDNYTAGTSNTQRYKCLGNGWTVDVIAHILSYL